MLEPLVSKPTPVVDFKVLPPCILVYIRTSLNATKHCLYAFSGRDSRTFQISNNFCTEYESNTNPS